MRISAMKNDNPNNKTFIYEPKYTMITLGVYQTNECVVPSRHHLLHTIMSHAFNEIAYCL